jgi:hypothetical protein
VEWADLNALSRLGAFPPRYLLAANRVPGAEQISKTTVLPVYETVEAARFARLWATRFALHIPVATTTVAKLRTEWGPRLAKARADLGLGHGKQTQVQLTHDDSPLPGRTWHDIARLVAPYLLPPGGGSELRIGADEVGLLEVPGEGYVRIIDMQPRRRAVHPRTSASVEAFWKSREWIFSDGGRPAVLTMTEFVSAVRHGLRTPIDREQLLALDDLDVFAPKHFLFAGIILQTKSRVLALMLPVYELPDVVRYVRLWRARFALHVPVATTTVDQLRTEWSTKLSKAREALGLHRGRRSDHTRITDLYRSITGKRWKEIAGLFRDRPYVTAEELASEVSRLRRRRGLPRATRFKEILPHPVITEGLARIHQRAQAAGERVCGALAEPGRFPAAGDDDFMIMVFLFQS